MKLNVNPYNPCDYFACCGLMELAWQLWPEQAVGWFQNEDTEFILKCDGIENPIGHACHELGRALQTSMLGEDNLIVLDLGGKQLCLDCLVKRELVPNMMLIGFSPGRGINEVFVGPSGLFTAYQEVLPPLTEPFDDVLNYPKNCKKLNLDPCSAYEQSDVGYSKNDVSEKIPAYPVRECLALVGLQRVRPVRSKNGGYYDTWTVPMNALGIPAAHLCGFGSRYRFNYRSTGKTDKFLSFANLRKPNV